MRYLHSMVRVADLDASLAFYCDKLGLVEIERKSSEEGRYTNVFLAAPGDDIEADGRPAPMIELTYNWDPEDYGSARNFGHLAYEVDDIYAVCQRLMDGGVVINRPPRDGNMAFVRSPDGISIEILQKRPKLAPRRTLGVHAQYRDLVGRVATRGAQVRLLRKRSGKDGSRVTFIELFFDLVFVFAVTQLSHNLLAHMTPMGGLQTLLLFTAVWWVWVNTSWCTNWLDPEQTPVRLMLMVLMLAGLCMSTSIPDAFGDKGLIFAGGMAIMQVGRSLFMLWALARHDKDNHRNFQRITLWLTLASSLWIAGAFAAPPLRLALWGAAALVETSGPAVGYWTPGLGCSTTEEWNVDGHHMAERCGLFIIIALGESILLTGATFSGLAITLETVAAFLAAFVGSVTMWWIYFDVSADTATERIAEDKNPGRLARLAYTYFHMPLVAGIIVCAVADELVLKHPGGQVSPATAAIMIGGPALYIVGNALFKRAIGGLWPRSHMLGLGLLALCIPVAGVATPLGLTLATTGSLLVVAAVETVRLRKGKAEAA